MLHCFPEAKEISIQYCIASQKPKNPYPALCNPNAEIPPFDIKLNPDNT
jgi:hypothetical protein